MNATTIKIEQPLLKSLYQLKPETQSLSAFVREMLEAGVRRRKMAEAAAKYHEFLAQHTKEASGLRDWEDADLAHPPAKRSKPGRS